MVYQWFRTSTLSFFSIRRHFDAVRTLAAYSFGKRKKFILWTLEAFTLVMFSITKSRKGYFLLKIPLRRPKDNPLHLGPIYTKANDFPRTFQCTKWSQRSRTGGVRIKTAKALEDYKRILDDISVFIDSKIKMYQTKKKVIEIVYKNVKCRFFVCTILH